MQAIGLQAAPLLGRLRRRGLENPLLPLPAVLAVAVGFFLPLAVLVVYSFWPTVDGRIVHQWTMGNYVRFFTEAAYWRMLLRSFWLVAVSSAFTVLLSFPFAYFVALKVRPSRRLAWILIAIIPFWTSYLIRVLAWLTMFGDEGFINQALTGLGLVDRRSSSSASAGRRSSSPSSICCSRSPSSRPISPSSGSTQPCWMLPPTSAPSRGGGWSR